MFKVGDDIKLYLKLIKKKVIKILRISFVIYSVGGISICFFKINVLIFLFFGY